jgi:hypothetical protein
MTPRAPGSVAATTNDTAYRRSSPKGPTETGATAKNEHLWLTGLLLVAACSWGRWLSTGSVKVDESYPSAAAGTALFGLLLIGWGLLVAGWWGLLTQPPENPRRLAFTGLLVSALMLPMLSNDVFSLLAYGSEAAHGRDVYASVQGLSQSPWYPWIGQHWDATPCVYGPTTLAAVLPACLGAGSGANPWVALAILRVVWLVPLAAVMQLSFARLHDRPLFHTMLWLNPLWLVEGPGQLHADMVGVVLVVAGILVQRRGRTRTGGLLYALAALGKHTFVLAGTWFWLSATTTWWQRALRAMTLATTIVLLGVLLYLPFWHGLPTLTEPVRALSRMNPGGSIVEVVGILVQLVRDGGAPRADMPVHEALELARATNGTTWFVTSLVLRILALGVGARVVRSMLRRPVDEGRIALGTGILIVVVVTLASHRFQSWYLMTALPFFGLACNRVWRRWWMAVVPLAVSTELIHVLPTTSPLLPVWSALSNGGVVVVFLISLRGRYFREGARPEAMAPQGAHRERARSDAQGSSSARTQEA